MPANGPPQRYRTIVADPPWPYDEGWPGDSGRNGAQVWPHESCFECRLRMPSDEHADAHYRMTGHAIGWPLDVDEMTWPVATDAQVMTNAR